MSELDKLAKVQPVSQKIGEFLEWLNVEKDLHLCERCERVANLKRGIYFPEGFYLARVSKNDLLAEFFHIDLKKIEQEKRKILEDLQKKRGEGETKFEKMVGQILRMNRIGRDELMHRIREKRRELRGFVTLAGCARLVAKELGIAVDNGEEKKG